MTAVGVAVANGQMTENSHDSSSSDSRGIVVDNVAEENTGTTEDGRGSAWAAAARASVGRDTMAMGRSRSCMLAIVGVGGCCGHAIQAEDLTAKGESAGGESCRWGSSSSAVVEERSGGKAGGEPCRRRGVRGWRGCQGSSLPRGWCGEASRRRRSAAAGVPLRFDIGVGVEHEAVEELTLVESLVLPHSQENQSWPVPSCRCRHWGATAPAALRVALVGGVVVNCHHPRAAASVTRGSRASARTWLGLGPPRWWSVGSLSSYGAADAETTMS
jgi:hypothetical protein